MQCKLEHEALEKDRKELLTAEENEEDNQFVQVLKNEIKGLKIKTKCT